MKRLWLIIFALAMNVSYANAQAPTQICLLQPAGNCTPVTSANPFPVNATVTASVSGFLSNGVFAKLTATAASSASTALPTGATAVRLTNNGTAVVSCTFATGAATALVDNILIQVGSSVSRSVGAFDHIACINETGSANNPVVIEGGSGLGNDSGGGSSSGGGGGSVTQGTTPWIDSITTWGGGTLGAMANYGTSPGSVLVPGVNAFITNTNVNGQATMANSSPIVIASDQSTITTQRKNDYPVGAVAITASATGTTTATTATLLGTASKTTYICWSSVRANATAATTVTDTITGVITGTLSSLLWVAPAASGLGVDEMIYSPCTPASAANTAIAVVSGAPGSGGNVTVKAGGYQL